jgi:hypothetical protein
MPNSSYSLDKFGAPGRVTGTTLQVVESSRTWWGKTVEWVVERRYLNNYRTEDGEEPEERTERTGNTRQARDGDVCWQECEEVANVYAKQYEFTLVQYEDWRINTTLQAWYDGVNSWSLGTVGSALSVGGAGAAASTNTVSAGIATFLLGGSGAATDGVVILGGEIAAGATVVATAAGLAGYGMGVFYITTNVMDSVLPAGEKSDEGWVILSQKYLGERLWRAGTPTWVQCGDKHPCADAPKAAAPPPQAEEEPDGPGNEPESGPSGRGTAPPEQPGTPPPPPQTEGEPGGPRNEPEPTPDPEPAPSPDPQSAPPESGEDASPTPPSDEPVGRGELASAGPHLSRRLIAVAVLILLIIGLIVGLVVATGSGPRSSANSPNATSTTIPAEDTSVPTIPKPKSGRTSPEGGSGFVAVIISTNEVSLGNASESPNICQDGGTLHVQIAILGIPAGTPVVVGVSGPSVASTNTFTANPGQPFGESFPIPPGSGAWTDQIISIGNKPPPTAGASETTSAVC